MEAHRKAGAFARRHKKHLLVGHAAAAAIALLVAFLVGAFAGPRLWTIYGTRLDQRGVEIYTTLTHRKSEKGMRGEALPPAIAAKVAALNDQVATGTTHPHPLATPQPTSRVELLARNYDSGRPGGVHPILLVVHDTESPNAPGLADVEAIRAWFNNPAAQASSNYTTDADGNTLQLVPDTAKAWTQAWFNPWAISDELIGYATQTAWPATQLRAVAEIFAAEAKKWGIPIQLGKVSGCTIVRAGIVDHAMLGACGGGHHDNGLHFPMAHFIALVRQYAAPPVAKHAAKPARKVAAPTVLRGRRGFWPWLTWRLGEGAWQPYGRSNPNVRPSVPARIPPAWWQRLGRFLAGRHA